MQQSANDTARAWAPDDGEAIWLAGALVTTKIPGDLTGNALTIAEHLVPADFAMPRHLHHVEDEILYILEGAIEARCGELPLRGGPGGMLFLPRGVPHSWRVTGAAPARLLVITTPAGYERFCAEAGTPAPARTPPTEPTAAEAHAKLLAVAPYYGLDWDPDRD